MAKALVNSAGKVLLRNGKVATTDSAACCCTTVDCPIDFDRPDPDSDYENPDPADPPYYCVQVIKFRFKVDQSEEDAGGLSGDFVDFGDTGFGFYADWEARNWVGYDGDSFATLPMGDAPVAETWHNAQLILLFNRKEFEYAAPGSIANGNVKTKICVDNVFSDATPPRIPTTAFDGKIFAGSNAPADGAITHRSITAVNFVTNNPAYSAINGTINVFPATPPGAGYEGAFNTSLTVGSGVSFAGDILRIDNESDSAYAVAPDFPLTCRCLNPGFPLTNLAYFNSITIEGTLSGTLTVPSSGGTPAVILTINTTLSQTWTRVDRLPLLTSYTSPGATPAPPGPGEFQIFMDQVGIERMVHDEFEGEFGNPHGNACEAIFVIKKDLSDDEVTCCDVPLDPEDPDPPCINDPDDPHPWHEPTPEGSFEISFSFLNKNEPGSPGFFAYTIPFFSYSADSGATCEKDTDLVINNFVRSFLDFTIADFDDFHNIALADLPGTYHYTASDTPAFVGGPAGVTGTLDYDATLTIG